MLRVGSRDISLLGALSALVVVADAVPVTPIIGVPGARFTAGWVAAALSGVVGGPCIGAAAALIGSVTSMLLGLRTAFLGPFTPFTPAVAGLEAGLLARGNWAAGAAVAASFAAAWALTPAVVTPPTVFYVAAVAVIFAARQRLELRPDRPGGRSFGRALAVAYVANATRHAFGSLLLVTFYGLPPETFFIVAPLMAVEQASFAVATALVAVPVLRAVSKTPLAPRSQQLVREKSSQ